MENRRINVTRSSMPPFEEYCAEIQGLWENRWLTNMGAKHQELQDRLSQYLEVEHIELLTNGHMAIELALQALELKGGGNHLTLYLRFYHSGHRSQRTDAGIL